jgi:hypothetical protein
LGDFPFILGIYSGEYLSDARKFAVVRLLSKDPTLAEVVYPDEDEFGVGVAMEMTAAARYGRQILEALCMLRVKGFSNCHLHLRNIFVDTETKALSLTDYENSIIGLRPQLQNFIDTVAAQIRSVEPHANIDPDVISFLHVFHEMVLGSAPKADHGKKIKISRTCPRDVQRILNGILKGKITDLVTLLETQLFAEAELPDFISSFKSVKDQIRPALPSAAATDEVDEVSV